MAKEGAGGSVVTDDPGLIQGTAGKGNGIGPGMAAIRRAADHDRLVTRDSQAEDEPGIVRGIEGHTGIANG